MVFSKISLTTGKRVADLGCGRTGHFVFPASRAVGETGIVYAVDIVKDVLENIRSRARGEGYYNVQTVWTDLEKVGSTPIPENSLEICFITNVLYLARDKAAILKEAARLLMKNGAAVIIDWRKKLGPLGPADDKMVSAEDVKKWGLEAGLVYQEDFNLGDYYYGVILAKI